ncbi:hypothetical protein GDO86_012075 [Hymenochirus boettgeri]|uniref:Deleted in lung and esophageal cancer protein 1 n=1 Tax=Hymenochirus boettgeri TaxID=247094 RepID=A0A8T2JJM8_9PIPI|nr:hypothetical protein GDO86_012075 [Hymenochirus boettgeri]
MATDELVTASFSQEPSSFRSRTSSDRTQEISHLLASLFTNLYTGEVIGEETGANLIRSKGGDNPQHLKFAEELQQIRSVYEHRLAEADIVEKHIIQAQARATVQEERLLSALKKEEMSVELPPVESQFRWCVDNDILRKLKLLCPEDYITDLQPITKAPKEESIPSFCKETYSFHQHISRSPVDDGYTELTTPNQFRSLDERSLTDSTSSVGLDDEKRTKRKSSKGKITQKEELHHHRFLKNPRYLLPNSVPGGRSLIAPAKKREGLATPGVKHGESRDPLNEVPVFLANPPVVFFPDYEVGQIYEMTVELRNMTASSRHLRVIPPSTPHFSLGLGKFPGEGGIVAPGMSCHYTVRFVPDSLADFEDFLLVETQAPYPVLIPIEARRPPPVLTLPNTLECGPCLMGGIKVLEYFCMNEGLSRGRFCIMPSSVWPPANFRSVATSGFVEQGPFGIRPAAFELFTGQGIILEIVFFPMSSETFSQEFTIVCDNCQVKNFTLTGCGQQVGLELISVSDDSSLKVTEVPNLITKHLVQFQSTNIHTTLQKDIVIRNATHVGLPFFWQIIRPSTQSLLPGEAVDIYKMDIDLSTTAPFTLTPADGFLQPHEDFTFTVTYTPTELNEHHHVAQMVLREIPEPPSASNKPRRLSEFTPMAHNVIVMDLDLKGTAEPFKILLEPYAIIFPGECFIGTTMRKQFKMWNNSKSEAAYRWENLITPHIIQIEPHTGTIEPGNFREFEIWFTREEVGFTSHKVTCHIEHSSEPVTLHVEATFKGPDVSIDIPSLDLGLIKLGNKAVSVLSIDNKSPLPARWRMRESQACLSKRNEQEYQFLIEPDTGDLLPLSQSKISILFTPTICQRVQTVLELQVENGEDSHLFVTADVQLPQVCLLDSSLTFTGIYVGVPATSVVKILNQGRLPARFSWGELTGNDSARCSATITPTNGILGPNEEAEMCVNLTSYTTDELDDIRFCCKVEDKEEPLVLNLIGKAEGLEVTYSLGSGDGSSDQELPLNGEDLSLDFGSSVPVQGSVQRKVILTNLSGVSAPFSVEAAYFSGSPVQKPPDSNFSTRSTLIKTPGFAGKMATKVQADFRRATLSDGKGAAFIPLPSSGMLEGFQQVTIDVTAYNNMWGEYLDELIFKVGDLKAKVIPMKMTVQGCPIYFQITGPKPGIEIEGPVIRFGTQLSGGDTISRCLRIHNPSPCDIRIDWETYNIKQDDSKLVDLLLLYGDLFPLKDIDGNEMVVDDSASGGCKNSPINWDKIPNSAETRSSLVSRTTCCFKDMDHPEDVEEDKESTAAKAVSNENKLISVIVRPHEGVSADYPYCITPRQMIVPAGGCSSVHVSFTPLILTGATNKTECNGFALGFLSLDDKFARNIPGKVRRLQGYEVKPIRMNLQACVKPSILSIEIEDEEDNLVFYSVASNLIPDREVAQILTEVLTTQNLKLINCTETPLYFRLLVAKPFVLSSIDPNHSTKTANSDHDAQGGQIVLHPQQNILVKVSFCTTLELLTYQNLSANQMLSGVQLLQSEDGEKKLHFTQQLVIEYSNQSTQLIPLQAFLSPSVGSFP